MNWENWDTEAWFKSLKHKWMLIWKVYILNSVIMPMIFLTVACFFNPVYNDLQKYAAGRPAFASPWSNFFSFFKSQILDVAFREEIDYRLYTWLLISTVYFGLFILRRFKPNNQLENNSLLWSSVWFIVWDVALITNIFWVKMHASSFSYVFIPLFVAGLSWNWLIIKTGKLWPAIASHMLANLSIYFLIKILIFSNVKIS